MPLLLGRSGCRCVCARGRTDIVDNPSCSLTFFPAVSFSTFFLVLGRHASKDFSVLVCDIKFLHAYSEAAMSAEAG